MYPYNATQMLVDGIGTSDTIKEEQYPTLLFLLGPHKSFSRDISSLSIDQEIVSP